MVFDILKPKQEQEKLRRNTSQNTKVGLVNNEELNYSDLERATEKKEFYHGQNQAAAAMVEERLENYLKITQVCVGGQVSVCTPAQLYS